MVGLRLLLSAVPAAASHTCGCLPLSLC